MWSQEDEIDSPEICSPNVEVAVEDGPNRRGSQEFDLPFMTGIDPLDLWGSSTGQS
jgi:hypothetical protein